MANNTLDIGDFTVSHLGQALRNATVVSSRAGSLATLVEAIPAGAKRDRLIVTFDGVETCPLAQFYEMVCMGDIDPEENINLDAAALRALIAPGDMGVAEVPDDSQVLSQADIDALFGESAQVPLAEVEATGKPGISQDELDALLTLAE